MISSDLMDVWWSLCRRRRREKKRQESIISRELESCAGASVDLDVAKVLVKELLGSILEAVRLYAASQWRCVDSF